MVEAALANPVAALFFDVIRHLLDILSESSKSFLSLIGKLHGSLLASGHVHVLRLTFNIFVTSRFFASVAIFATLEVVVLALGALPATIGELEVLCLSLGLLRRLLGLPGPLCIHLGEDRSFNLFWDKTVHFLGKLSVGGNKRSSLLIQLQVFLDLLSGLFVLVKSV